MKQFSFALIVLGLACVAFGSWGVNSRAGSRMFEEMAGMIPFFVGVAGGFLALIGAGLCIWQRLRG
jgi:hypothetical protein